MKVACHQPTYLPWPGFFYKAMRVDVLVLLDCVQFPRGSSWVNRNRIKTPRGQTWLTVPVKKKGRGLQRIKDVEVFNERLWAQKHIGSLIHSYKRSPFLEDHLEFLERTYRESWSMLVDVNASLLKYFLKQLNIDVALRFSSELGTQSKGTSLLVEICEKLKADVYVTMITSRTHLEEELFHKNGIKIDYYNYRCPGYPQLWGDFIPNLSIVDLVFNCGPKALAILGKG